MEEINDLEELVVAIVGMHPELEESRHRYRLAKKGTGNDMLSWRNPPELQVLETRPFARVGIVGDGNCMLHTILFAMSPTYRKLRYKSQSVVADDFREILELRMDELEARANEMYMDIGGAEGLDDSFAIIPQRREELSIEMGPIICRQYGCNFLAVRLTEDLEFLPVTQTYNNGRFDPSLPTVFVNYMGGEVDVGVGSGFEEDGHYEVIIGVPPDGIKVVGAGRRGESNSNISSSDSSEYNKEGKRKKRHVTRKQKQRERAGPRVTLDADTVMFSFPAGSATLAPIVATFSGLANAAAAEGAAEVGGVIAARIAREAAAGGQGAGSENSNLERALAASLVEQGKEENLPVEGGGRQRRTKKRRHYKH
jgi:hypothetical protein